jgi:zinc transport system ATP-binding protein
MTGLLKVENLSFSYLPEEMILSEVSFELDRQKSLGIIGPNGGGKSTLLKILSGLLEGASGTIQWKGNSITTTLSKEARISYVPQKDTVNTSLPVTVKDMVTFGALPQKVTKVELDKILSLVGLNDIKKKLIRELSGGQLQRVLLAKAVIRKPEILLLDEPTKGLDSTGQDQLLELIEKVMKDFGCAVILVDHNINQVIKHCDQILCLNRTHHWHDKKEMFSKDIMDSVYHCEFEHTLIHEQPTDGKIPEHHKCTIHGDDHDHD